MKNILSCLCPIFFLTMTGRAQDYPPPGCIYYDDGTLFVCPPDSIPSYSGGLLGYNLYEDGVFLAFIQNQTPDDTVAYDLETLPEPGEIAFCARAVYVNWMSDPLCDTSLVYYGYPLPFLEDWSSASFETNHWTPDGDHWGISTGEGNPSPSAVFHGQNNLTDYEEHLISYVFLGDSIIISTLFLDFDIMLNSINSTGDEKLYVQIWNWNSKVWSDFYMESNENGSFGWKHVHTNVNILRQKLFKIRFKAEGSNANDIIGWYVDNVRVYRTCFSPQELVATVNDDNQIELNWAPPAGCGESYYWLWLYTYDYYASVGTGNQAIFDVAARWTSAMLQDYNHETIKFVEFYPAEENATYAVRIWEGDSAALVYEQQVPDPETGKMNRAVLDSLYLIDASKTLWIGYHIEAQTGYPAGADEGPALDGYSNMIYFNNTWSTLLELAFLDYSWLIQAYVGTMDPMYCGNRIYRKVNDGDYSPIADVPMYGYYLDEDADPSNLNCYKVTDVIAKNYDTCESGYSNESCSLPIGFPEMKGEGQLLIYPNPSNGDITVESPSAIVEIKIYDLIGRLVYDESFDSGKVVINADYLKNGIYVMKIYNVAGLFIRKVIVD